ncbi:MAG: hypothetical protein K9G49_13370 [Taibaiella sp.]|nr:hypothetical protein [Taibaiella sp.]
MKFIATCLISLLSLGNAAAQIALSKSAVDDKKIGKCKLIRQADGKLLFVTATGGNFYSGRLNANSEIDDTYNGLRTSKKLSQYANCKTLAIKTDKWNRIILAGSSMLNNGRGHVATITRFTKNGDIDKDFKSDLVRWPIGDSSEITGVFLQNDEKIVATGSTHINGAYHFFIARFLYNGEYDTGFANKGIAIDYNMPYNNRVVASAMLQDGKYIIAGNNYTTNSCNIIAARYNNDGSKDTTFGISSVDSEGNNPRLKLMSVQTDGKIVLAGESGDDSKENGAFLMRYNSDGKSDISFGKSGITRVNPKSIDRIDDLALLADGRILLTGACSEKGEPKSSRYTMLRYSPDGLEDEHYGYGGKKGLKPVVVNPGYTTLANNITVSPVDGKVYKLSELVADDKTETILLLSTYLQDTALGIIDIPTGKLQNFIYPVPVSKGITFTFDLIEDLNISAKLLDKSGNEIFTLINKDLYKEGENKLLFNLPLNTKPGKYLVVISSDVGYKVTVEITKV